MAEKLNCHGTTANCETFMCDCFHFTLYIILFISQTSSCVNHSKTGMTAPKVYLYLSSGQVLHEMHSISEMPRL